jgi:hypothetical protein
MKERKRQRTDDQQPGAGPDAGTGGEELDAMRRRARDLITTGNEAIARVLSTDSKGFLRSSEQEGGQ